MEKRKKEAQKEAARINKAVAIMSAIINTAQAVTKTLAEYPFPLSAVMAAAQAALGAVQISLIKNQPIPLAKGAIFKRPTYLVGEAGEEALIPLTQLPKLVKESVKEIHHTEPQQINIQNTIILGNQKFEDYVVKVVERKAGLGQLKIPAKAVMH